MRTRAVNRGSDKKLSEKELNLAFLYWYREYLSKEADEEVKDFLKVKAKPWKQNEMGWLPKARRALLLSSQTVAENLKIQRAVYSKFEANESKGNISLQSLSKAAEAMGCELIYCIRPKENLSFSKVIWNKILIKALRSSWLDVCDQKRLGNGLAFVAKNLMKNPKFRNENKWSKRLKS
ncbi:MAG TPA: helix-turn-helix domain-containing protein [Pseudobdellovibrionaceae bacterium]|nr:helix-turn-helix domain-containing protein [Pseudobdellovibrionaceae bacterium]